MGVASGCGEQQVGVASGSGWNLWVWLLGVVVRRYIDFLILLIPTPLVSVLFYSSIPTFLFIFLKCFSFFNYIERCKASRSRFAAHSTPSTVLCSRRNDQLHTTVADRCHATLRFRFPPCVVCVRACVI